MDLTMKEILELLKKYGEEIDDHYVNIIIYDDETGDVMAGHNLTEQEIHFTFHTVTELVDGLRKYRIDI